MFLRLIRSYRSAEVTDPFDTVHRSSFQGNANSVQKEHSVNSMNLLDEQTTFLFKKTGSEGYKKFSVESLETQPFGSECCINAS